MARPTKTHTPAIAYLRTSSAGNVGADKDSEKRQRQAIAGFAKRNGFELVGEHYDAAVSGADPIETRPGFKALLDRIEANGVRVVIVEDASRFARELMAQELGIVLLTQRGVRLLTANGDDLTDTKDPSRKMMRQVAGAFAEYEKTRLVEKLAAARKRRREDAGKCEGRWTRLKRLEELAKKADTDEARTPYQEAAEALQAAIAMARRLRRASPKTGERRSLRKISAELEKAGYLNERGRPYNPNSIRLMLES
jgi:DNA invertase Pin-like site-specific DNA recombinase